MNSNHPPRNRRDFLKTAATFTAAPQDNDENIIGPKPGYRSRQGQHRRI